ncbi:MAG: DUF2914 domain-containing protein [Desulfosarcina sp.]|nr:DUF2914 domain-containing protein [Desulfobacterales bacterium]
MPPGGVTKARNRPAIPALSRLAWRTYASKKIGDRQGNWKVYLQDKADQILGTVQFVVE